MLSYYLQEGHTIIIIIDMTSTEVEPEKNLDKNESSEASAVKHTSAELQATTPQSLQEYFNRDYIQEYIKQKLQNIEKIKAKQGDEVKRGTQQSLDALAHVQDGNFTSVDVRILRSLLGGEKSATLKKKVTTEEGIVGKNIKLQEIDSRIQTLNNLLATAPDDIAALAEDVGDQEEIVVATKETDTETPPHSDDQSGETGVNNSVLHTNKDQTRALQKYPEINPVRPYVDRINRAYAMKESEDRPKTLNDVLSLAQSEKWDEDTMLLHLRLLEQEGLVTHHEQKNGPDVYTAIEQTPEGDENRLVYVSAQNPIRKSERNHYALAITSYPKSATRRYDSYDVTVRMGVTRKGIDTVFGPEKTNLIAQNASSGNDLERAFKEYMRLPEGSDAKTLVMQLNGSRDKPFPTASTLSDNLAFQLMPGGLQCSNIYPEPGMFAHLQDEAIFNLFAVPSSIRKTPDVIRLPTPVEAPDTSTSVHYDVPTTGEKTEPPVDSPEEQEQKKQITQWLQEEKEKIQVLQAEEERRKYEREKQLNDLCETCEKFSDPSPEPLRSIRSKVYRSNDFDDRRNVEIQEEHELIEGGKRTKVKAEYANWGTNERISLQSNDVSDGRYQHQRKITLERNGLHYTVSRNNGELSISPLPSPDTGQELQMALNEALAFRNTQEKQSIEALNMIGVNGKKLYKKWKGLTPEEQAAILKRRSKKLKRRDWGISFDGSELACGVRTPNSDSRSYMTLSSQANQVNTKYYTQSQIHYIREVSNITLETSSESERVTVTADQLRSDILADTAEDLKEALKLTFPEPHKGLLARFFGA